MNPQNGQNWPENTAGRADGRIPLLPLAPGGAAPDQDIHQPARPNEASIRPAAPNPEPVITNQPPAKPAAAWLIGFFKALANLATFVALVWLGVVLINHFAFQSYFVQGTSMQPTLQNNDRLIISKFERTGAMLAGVPYLPARGQIVVLDSRASPFTAVQKEELVKRVIGLPGDTVIIDGGSVTIKNANNPGGFNADQALGLRLGPTYAEQTLSVEVPAGQVFVLGDNRGPGGSYDSRLFGTVPAKYIEGRLWIRLLPLNNFHVF